MSLADDFLAQAAHLAKLDPRRPKQVNLRRAVSAAYYALFHLLSGEAAGLYAIEFGLVSRICRTHNHGDMKKVSSLFSAGRLPKAIQPPGQFTISADLRDVARTFVVLQQSRHEADYERTRNFRRTEALNSVERVRNAFAAWGKVRKTDDARLYLACFLLWDRWDKEPR